MFTVPTIVKMLVEHPAVDAWDHSSLRYVIYAGAPMYREDQKRALESWGRCWCSTSAWARSLATSPCCRRPCMRRRTRPARAWALRHRAHRHAGQHQDDSGRQLDPGQPGEICVCGPAVFAGYYANPQANEKAFRDGWFRTGDLGYMDAEGFVYITGRQSDMYISGGSNIYPREVEERC